MTPRRPLAQALFAAALVAVAASAARAQDDLDTAALFERDCAVCHVAGTDARAPTLEAMRGLSPNAVVTALTTGRMALQGEALSPEQRASLAELLTGQAPSRQPVSANLCMADAPSLADALDSAPAWNGWGAGLANTRFQPAAQAGLAAGDLPELELLWAFGFPDALAARTQPTVVGGWVFTAGENGQVYALDADSGCTRWTFQADAAVRTAIGVARVEDADGAARIAAFFGDGRANAYAVNAETGDLLWLATLDQHPNATITGAPSIHDGRVYIPTSAAGEEVRGGNPDYACCSFRGSVTALDAATGQALWKTYAIAPEPTPRGTSATGVTLYGPAGAGIWGAPTIDPARGLLYVGTGNGYAGPAQPTTNAILALRLADGGIEWVQQTLPNDIWLWQCESEANAGNPNCPEEQGPDFDFGTSPLLTTTPSGRDLLVVPQKSAMLYALDPDDGGRVLWEYRFGVGSALGGQWGAAADADAAYVGVADTLSDAPGGVHAVDLETGAPRWFAPPRPVLCDAATETNCYAAQGGALTAADGFLLSGGSDGGVRAYSTADGALLWEFDTNRAFETVNGVPAHGATMDAAGPVVAGGRIYVNSGYNGIVGRAGNVLLAFGPPSTDDR